MKASKKYQGVYVNTLANGDISYYIGYTDLTTGDYKKVKIGRKSQGVTEPYCYNKRAEVINKLRLGEDPLSNFAKKNRMKFDLLVERYFNYMQDSGKPEKSVKNEQSRYKLHIQRYIGSKNSYAIDASDINKIHNIALEKELSSATLKHIRQLIATIFNFAIKTDWFNAKNPVYSIEVPKIKVNNRRERFLDKYEVEKILQDPRVSEDFILNRFARFALSTGARLGTLLDIQRKDINIATRTVALKNLKTNNVYNGFLSEHLLPDLSFLHSLSPNAYVISKDGKKTEQTRVQHHLKPILDELFNIDLDKKDSKNRVVVHTLRHTFASNLAINGTPIFHIQKLLDHQDQAMTQRYAKLAPDSGFSYVNGIYA
jgi:integrase